MQTGFVPRFTTSNGHTLFFLDGLWRDSPAVGLSDLLFYGDESGPLSDADEPLDGLLDTVEFVCRIDWMAGPRCGQSTTVPMTPAERMVSHGLHQLTGWTLARGIAPDCVTECLEYAINQGPALEGRRFLADDAVEQDIPDQQPNLAFRVEAHRV